MMLFPWLATRTGRDFLTKRRVRDNTGRDREMAPGVLSPGPAWRPKISRALVGQCRTERDRPEGLEEGRLRLQESVETIKL